MVVELDILLALMRQPPDPRRPGRRPRRVEVGRARDADVGEEVRVSREGDGRGELDVGDVGGGVGEDGGVDVGVRGDGGDAEEEGGRRGGGGGGEEGEGFGGQEVDGVLAGVGDGGVAVALVGGVEVVVGVRVEEEVGGVPAGWEGGVVVGGGVGVEELAGVEGVVAGVLEPDGEVVGVEALGDEFGVAAWDGVSEVVGGRGRGRGGGLPYGGFTSVTFVLCACFPVRRETREGQQMAVVQ